MSTHCLHIGINDYRGTGHDLAGCLRDAHDAERLFNSTRRHKGTRRDAIDVSPFFGRCDTQVLVLDKAATRRKILAEIDKLMRRLGAGDWGVITFSGHGTYVRDASHDEADGFDEALVAWGLDLVLDDELGTRFERRDARSKLLVITDACHSGTATRTLGPRLLGPTAGTLRFLPPARIPDRHRAGWRVGPRRTPKLVNAIHLAACLDDQFAEEQIVGGRPGGVFSWHLHNALASLSPGATFADWCAAIAKHLPNSQYDQEPQVNSFARALSWKIPTN